MLKKPVTLHTFSCAGYHCRHCGMPHSQGLRRANHKNPVALESDVLELLREGIRVGAFETVHHVMREPVAAYFEVPEHQVEQVFQKLKIQGYLGTAVNKAPHDSRREPMGYGDDSAWMGSRWPVHSERFEQEQKPTTPRRKM